MSHQKALAFFASAGTLSFITAAAAGAGEYLQRYALAHSKPAETIVRLGVNK